MENPFCIRKLALQVNARKPEGAALIPEIEAACARAGIALFSERSMTMRDVLREADALLVLGGDGTILHALGLMTERILPVLGVNIGTLGFLTECAPGALSEAIGRLAAGEYRLERRMLINAKHMGSETVYTALNDIVVTRGGFMRVLHADIHVDGVLVSHFEGDGAMVASPTGSTAYSLAAGGPIIAPGLDCFVLTPVCPHTLSSRPIVVSSAAKIRFELTPRGEDGGMQLSVDGAQRMILNEPTTLSVWRSDRALPFIRFQPERFFELLRNKLSKWGGELPPTDGK